MCAGEQHLFFSQLKRPSKRFSKYLHFKYLVLKYLFCKYLCVCFCQSDNEDPRSQPRSLADSVSSGSAEGVPPYWLLYYTQALLPGFFFLMRRTQVQEDKRPTAHLSWCQSIALGTSRALATGRTKAARATLARLYIKHHTVPRDVCVTGFSSAGVPGCSRTYLASTTLRHSTTAGSPPPQVNI